jgi:hypothetical protein
MSSSVRLLTWKASVKCLNILSESQGMKSVHMSKDNDQIFQNACLNSDFSPTSCRQNITITSLHYDRDPECGFYVFILMEFRYGQKMPVNLRLNSWFEFFCSS